MNLILKSAGSDFILPDTGVLITTAGSDFSSIPGLVRALGQSVDLRNRVIAGTVVVNNGSQDLSSLAGQQYLNQMWLQSGHDIAVQMAQVEGTISDVQHGSRSGGTLHAEATGSVSGFFSAADFTKLAGISANAHNTISLTFGGQTGSGVEQTGAAYLVARYFYFPGSTDFGTLSLLSIIAQRSSGTGTCVALIYDVTNGAQIAIINTITAATPTIYQTAAFTNVPTGPAVFRLDISGGAAGTKVVVHGMDLE